MTTAQPVVDVFNHKNVQEMRIAFSGARPPKFGSEQEWILWSHLLVVLEEVVLDLSANALIVHGAAEGVDLAAKNFAEERSLRTEAHPADWARYGNRAGILRNVYVTTCPILHAFPAPWSKGTWNAIERGLAARIVVVNHAERYWPKNLRK